MPTTENIEVQLDSVLKQKVEERLHQLDLTPEEFTRIILTRFVAGELDDSLEIANEEVLASLQEVIDNVTGKRKLPAYHDFDSLNDALLK